MPWNIILPPVLLCLVWGVKKGLEAKGKKDLSEYRKTSLYE